MKRRDWMVSLGGLGVGLGSARGMDWRDATSVSDAGTGRARLSIAAYSFRDSLAPAKGERPAMDMLRFAELAADMGFDAVEVTGYYLPDPPSDEYLIDLRRTCYRLGLEISGAATRSDFGFLPGSEEAEKNARHVERWIDVSDRLHAPTLRIFAGQNHAPSTDDETTHRWMVENLHQSCTYAAKRGIVLGLENHGGPTTTAEGLVSLLRDVDHVWLAANLDTGNFRGPVDPYEQMTAVAPYAVNVQLKAVLAMPSQERVPVDMERVHRILEAARYRGYVVLEYEEPGNVEEACRELVVQMRSAFGN